MPDQVIKCPYCQKEIPLTEAISHQIKEKLKKEFKVESDKREQELKQKLEKEAKQKAKESIALELKDLQEELGEKDKKLIESQKAELDLRKERRKLEEDKKTFELEMTRKLDTERERIKEDSLKKVAEEYRLKDMEKEKLVSDMRKQIEELKRKAEQGSQQTQGEVLELDLEEILKSNFPLDQIEPVPKGIKGADILQKINNQAGRHCGTIIWESKRTKAWSNSWIEKLKDDQRDVKAEIAVLMTTVLPKGIDTFSYMDGIWVTNHALIVGLATALRMNLIQIADSKIAAEGKEEKMEVLYSYLSGPEFRQKIEAIVETFASMKRDLDQEKRAMTRIWSKRDKQIERVVNNISGMYGDMQGMIGASLPQIKSLELKTLTDGNGSEESNEEE